MKFTATWTMALRAKHVAATRIITNSRPVFTCKEEG